MLDLQALERVLAPLEELGHDELTFDAGGTEVTLRYMTPEEETEAQRWASELMPQTRGEDAEEVDAFVVAEYLDRFKIAVISYSLIRVGGQALGDYIETGEELDNGAKVKVVRHKALRQLLPKWGRPVLTAMFRKYAELMDRVDQKADGAIKFDPSDIEAEIERLTARLATLQREHLRRTLPEEGTDFAGKVAAAATFEAGQQAEVQRDLDTIRDAQRSRAKNAPTTSQAGKEKVPEPAPVAAAPRERRSIIPEGAVPITAPSTPHAPRTTAPQPVESAPRQPMDTAFIDPDDPASMAAAVASENARLMAARQPQVTREALVPDTKPAATRQPPHAGARAVEEELQAVQAGAAAAEEAGEVGGLPAYRLPVQELGSKETPQGGSVNLDNPNVSGGSRNPRFRPPTQGG